MRSGFIFRVIVFLSAFGIIFYLTGNPLGKFICIDNPLDHTDFIVVEGWLSKSEIHYVASIFRKDSCKYLITTGIRNPDYLQVGKNSDITWKFNKSLAKSTTHNLEINAYGTEIKNIAAEIEVLLNDSSIGSVFTKSYPEKYSFTFHKTDTLKTIKVRFLNDAFVDGIDRNLYISNIVLDSVIYSVNDTLVTQKVRTSTDSTLYFMAPTKALEARINLLHEEISGSKILSISTLNSNLSRTYSTAKETMHKIDSLFPGQNFRFNIVTRALHSRRTYYAYKKNCKPGDEVGVIVVPPLKPIVWNNRKRNLKELAGIVFNLLHF